MFSIFIHFRGEEFRLVAIKSALGMISAKQCRRIRFRRYTSLVRFGNGTTHYLCLRHLPGRGESLEPIRRRAIQCESRSMSHNWHTITHTITLLTPQGSS